MKRNTLLVALLATAATLAAAQMSPGGMGQPQQPGMPGSGPDMGRPGTHLPDQTGTGQDQPTLPPKVDDGTLQRQVHEQLASNGQFANVQVSVKNGVVHLDGSVPSKEDAKQARKIAKSVRGVYGVKDKLTVSANAGSQAHSTTGAENTGTANMGGTSGAAATSTGSTTVPAPSGGSTTAMQNPTSGVSSPSERGTVASDSGALGHSPCTCAPAGSAGASLPQPGATGTSSAGTMSSPTAGATGASGASTAGQNAGAQPCVCPQAGGSSATATGTSGGMSGTASTGSMGSNAGQASQSGSVAAPVNSPNSGNVASGQSSPGSEAQSETTNSQPSTGTSGQQGGNATAAGQSTGSFSTPQGNDLGGQVTTALRQEPTLANDNIQASATDDTIVLTGTVATGKEKQTAKRIADSFAANRRVVDQITVSGKGMSNSQNPQ